MTDPAAWNEAERILAVRLDAIGDVLMTTPALRALKESRPGRHLTLLTSYAGAQVARLLPMVDEVLEYDAPWMKATAPRSDIRPDLEFIDRLRRGRFDAAVIFTVFSQNPLPAALLCFLAGIPRRLAHCRENPYQLLNDWVPEIEPHETIRHEVRRQLDLVAAVGARARDERLSLRIPPSSRPRVDRLLRELGIRAHQPWIVVHPGSTAPSRRYPAEGFAEAAGRLAREDALPIIFTGSDPERSLIESIRDAMGAPSFSMAGALDLGTLAALIARASLLLANNTGPVHIAAAVGTPVVDLYALTNPQHTPWMVPHRVLSHAVPCRYCYKSLCPEGHHDCLRRVPPEAVVGAVRALLAETRGRASRAASPVHDVPNHADLVIVEDPTQV
jgi:lipopolysaccharide heptosyltransferase II